MIPQTLPTRKTHVKEVMHPLFSQGTTVFTKKQGRNTIPFRALKEPTVIGTVYESLDLHFCSTTYMGRSETKAGSTKPVVNPGKSVPWNLFICQKENFPLFLS
jgi:hypothetical protein